jgi:hypothetical protein
MIAATKPSLLFRLVNKAILNLRRDFAKPFFSAVSLFTIQLKLGF